MARVTLTKTTIEGPFGDYGAGEADLNLQAADITDKNQFKCTGKDIVIAQNTDVGAQTVTITSYADPYGRTKDITAYSLAADDVAIFGPFGTTGWMQADGYVYLEASAATVKFAVVAL